MDVPRAPLLAILLRWQRGELELGKTWDQVFDLWGLVFPDYYEDFPSVSPADPRNVPLAVYQRMDGLADEFEQAVIELADIHAMITLLESPKEDQVKALQLWDAYWSDVDFHARKRAKAKPGAILRTDAMPMLAKASAGFLDFERCADDDDGLVIHLNDFASYLKSNLQQGQTEDFPAVFAVVEGLLTRGDPYVREMTMLGLLEALQNENLKAAGLPYQPEDFLPYLNTEGKLAWQQVSDFWSKFKLWTDLQRDPERDR